MRNLFLLYVFAWSFYFAGCTGQSDGVAPSNDLTSVSDAPIITSPSSNPYYSNSGTLNLSGTCYGDATVALNGDSAQTVACSGSSFTFAVIKPQTEPTTLQCINMVQMGFLVPLHQLLFGI